MTDRFIVVERSDSRVPEYERDPDGWAVIDTATGQFVGCDGGEPEDQLLVRDWDWVPKELNRLAAELDSERARQSERTARTLNASNALADNPYRVVHVDRLAALERVAEAAREVRVKFNGGQVLLVGGKELTSAIAALDHLLEDDTLNDLLNRANRYSDQIAAELEQERDKVRRVEALLPELERYADYEPDPRLTALVEPLRRALTAPAPDEKKP